MKSTPLVLLATINTGFIIPGCDAPFHVLVSAEGRPMRVYEDPYSCQVAAVWHQERGQQVECVVMSRARLSLFTLNDTGRDGP